MRALLIEVNFRTGERAGNINPRDANFPCWGWQNLDVEPGIEIRLVKDDGLDLSYLDGVAGIAVLNGETAINQAIIANIPVKYAVKDKELLLAHMGKKNKNLDDLAGKTLDDVAEQLYNDGLAGIVKREPKLV